MVPGVCRMKWKQNRVEATGTICSASGSPSDPRQYHMHSERHGRPVEEFSRDCHLRTEELSSSTSAFVPSAILVMSFPLEGLITLANRSNSEQYGGRNIT